MPPASKLRRRRRLTSLVGAAVVVLLGGALSIATVTMTADASAQLDALLPDATDAVADARANFDELRDTRDAAQVALDDSAGSVLDEAARDALAAALDETSLPEADARAELEAADELLDRVRTADRSVIALGEPLREAATAIGGLEFDDLERFSERVAALDEPLAALAVAVDAWNAAWKAEQERILRERYTNHVWTSGWIPELDACRGSVDLSAQYGIGAIAEHWSCGGKDFPDDPGTIITLTGVHAGTYRVEGIVKMLNQSTATVADLPHGYDLIYQTCQNGQSSTMSLTGLTRLD
ncbi:hypothetical protein J7E25_03900 [Agromyces sp. ISL-38]|uniref:hypothetical protein n=1 Tax=Agromyces sp. ISL-38 TaxID=2819107 RepID=UPI001BE6EFAD|nr:hypothetical protein [Agromyces sp. ISL-38]MBT2498229.1 hypothetical protein [Agromyces sp. ISL-38]MBT2518621.1 hypothetical protein [Streptomyces sp. ISL-90]